MEYAIEAIKVVADADLCFKIVFFRLLRLFLVLYNVYYVAVASVGFDCHWSED